MDVCKFFSHKNLHCTIVSENVYLLEKYTFRIMSSIFTYRDNTEGKVGIGKLPENLNNTLEQILIEYKNFIPDTSVTTYHTYYNDLTGSLKSNFDKIQYNPFWNGVCDNTNKCIIQPVFEMNEIYYSNPKPNFKNMNLYGAAANLIPHRDCILYNFNGIRFYRIIIGMTDDNNDTITEFINFNMEHKINKGDYMIFDFDRTLHQVKKTGEVETPRLLLKLHFIVCENCNFSKNYVHFISYFYKYYYYVARYTEQIGTDPTTFMGFFFGIMWEYPFLPMFKWIVLSFFIINFVVLNQVYKIKFVYKNIRKLAFYSVLDFSVLYAVIVSFYYFRFVLFGIK